MYGLNTKHDSPNYTCTKCGMSFNKEAEHKRHTQNFHKCGYYQCGQRGMSFNRSTDLKKHNTIVHKHVETDACDRSSPELNNYPSDIERN